MPRGQRWPKPTLAAIFPPLEAGQRTLTETVLAWAHGEWLLGYLDTANDVWETDAGLVPQADVSHWIGLPPDPTEG